MVNIVSLTDSTIVIVIQYTYTICEYLQVYTDIMTYVINVDLDQPHVSSLISVYSVYQ